MRRFRPVGVLITTAMLVLALPAVSAPGRAEPRQGPTMRLGTLEPGRTVIQELDVPVNIVLIGYDRQRVAGGLAAQLSASAEPVVRYPRFYGLEGRPLGLRYRYDYRIIDAPKAFEDRFFGHLRRTSDSEPRTVFQQAYNDMSTNVLDVSEKVLSVDAVATERYLERAARARLGLRSAQAYTVFLVNWWGRKDFRFHVYRKTDRPDPDTGINFGEKGSRAGIAWGGTTGRSWFYDLSAGPEAWSYNFDVDNDDLDGNGVTDYRMPPVWEYAEGGDRDPGVLPADLGRVVRYIAVNLLFTSSPLYDPQVSSPDPGGAKHVRTTLFEGNPDVDGEQFLRLGVSRAAWTGLEPYHRWRTSLGVVDPTPPDVKQAVDITLGNVLEPGCWEQYGFPFAQLFCFFDARREDYLPSGGKDYVTGVYAFSGTDEQLAATGLLGYADDNWADGTPSYVFEFLFPEASGPSYGYGLTDTTTHEVGHHVGLSHPHDGYDPATGVDYVPQDEFTYVWTGDHSDSVMSYLAVSGRFGVFDRDNMARYHFAGYVNRANALLGELAAEDLTRGERSRIRRADRLAARAEQDFRRWRFQAAAGRARYAWALVQSVAERYGVEADPAPSAARLGPPSLDAKPEPEPIRFPDE